MPDGFGDTDPTPMNVVIQRGEILDWVSEVGTADILVGIPSFNNAGTIGHVVKAVQAGLAKYFPDCRAVLVNSDGGSGDGTMDVVRRSVVDDFDSLLVHHRVRPLAKLATPYHGLPGKGSAFRTFFEIAAALEVKACAVVDSDLRSITPEWIELLVKPILTRQYDFASPLYRRHKYDGTITNSIIYPMTRALYGKRVRQPIGGDFGFSGELAGLYLSKDVWESDVARFGIDIWMTTTAIANGFRICQSYLGAKIHDPKDPGADLSSMLFQVVGSTFELMETYADVWRTVSESQAVPTFGFQYAVGLEPVNVNIERMLDKFRLGVQELSSVWQEVLSAWVLEELEKVAAAPPERFRLQEEVWVEIVYSFAVAAHSRRMNREHLLKSLTPLYIGRTASFVLETRDSDSDEVEEKIESLCRIFESNKSRLLKNWEPE